MIRTVCFSLSVAVLWPAWSAAEENRVSPDEQAIRRNAAAYTEAYNQHDAKTLAALWSPEAVYTCPTSGERVVGRAAIEKAISQLFEGDKKSHLDVEVGSIEFVSPNVAIERGTARVTREKADPEVDQYTAVHVKRDGQWLIDRVSEDVVPKPPQAHEELKKLEWLIGSWIDEDERATVETHCQWARDENFIIWKFAATIGDRVRASGIQVIGYDAAQKRFRSWVFDSDGGFAEAVWQQQGNRWLVRQTGTLPDGRRSTAVNVITKIDDNTMTWQSTDREIGGRIEPNINEIRIVRQGAAQGSEKREPAAEAKSQ